ncbi:unnamed protein product [Linum trigynum]|uniref:Uncharacterized protein n=1 Tax=Linum trigynum TaxID=586398 RepID=A0AAV2FBH7_9ROSI
MMAGSCWPDRRLRNCLPEEPEASRKQEAGGGGGDDGLLPHELLLLLFHGDQQQGIGIRPWVAAAHPNEPSLEPKWTTGPIVLGREEDFGPSLGLAAAEGKWPGLGQDMKVEESVLIGLECGLPRGFNSDPLGGGWSPKDLAFTTKTTEEFVKQYIEDFNDVRDESVHRE